MKSKLLLSLLFAIPGLLLAQPEVRVGSPIKCNFNAPNLPMLPGNGGYDTVIVSSSASNGRSNVIGAEFEVKYIGFPPNAQAAVQKAIDIWSATLKSPVKIRVFINWTVLQNNPNTLAFVVPTEVRNFPGNPTPNLWYPMALAEKIAGQEINSESEADIVATFNAGRSDWYFGTDQQTPANQFSLTTIALHELGHGLGFSGTFRVASTGEGSFGSTDGQAKIYDQYIFNGSGQKLLGNASFPNGSFALANQITSNSLVFKSEIANTLGGGASFPRIYAPNPYNGGSSISHLDENTYNGTDNSLMTPFIDRGQTQFNVGPLTKGMFYEMGWLYTKLNHTPVADQESLTAKKFQLAIESDTTINVSTIKLFYSTDGFTTPQETSLTFNGASNKYEGEMTSVQIENSVQYYFEVQDVLNRSYRLPLGSTNFGFYYGIDTKKPVINHTVPGPITQFDTVLPIAAVVSDNLGVQFVELEYQVNDEPAIRVPMSGASGSYQFDLQLGSLNLQQGDIIKYRIKAVDASQQGNTSLFPESGFNQVQVRTFEVRDQYLSDLNTNQGEFFGDFVISTPTGFTNGAIHTKHPYAASATAEGSNTSLLLLYPLLVNEINNLIEFDEVVLIEPGQGSDYTKPEFGDYVIVEGTLDGGTTWLPLTPGYDSRQQPLWLNYYNSNLVSGDSKAIGTLNYFVKKQISITDTFQPGDEIFLRFRLHSNSTSVGWGWAIDNLKIQDVVIGLADLVPGNELPILLYPNPAEGQLQLKVPPKFSALTVQIEVTDPSGRPLKAFERWQEAYPVDDLPAGTYLLKLQIQGEKSVVIKWVKT